MENEATKHICGVCHDEWLSEAEYLNHVCPNTNATPQDVSHLVNSTTPDFEAISQAAQERGAADVQAQAEAQAAEQSDTEQPADPNIQLQ